MTNLAQNRSGLLIAQCCTGAVVVVGTVALIRNLRNKMPSKMSLMKRNRRHCCWLLGVHCIPTALLCTRLSPFASRQAWYNVLEILIMLFTFSQDFKYESLVALLGGSVCVCVCLCEYLCLHGMFVCVCVSLKTCVYVCATLGLCICLCLYVCACVFVSMCLHMFLWAVP